MSILLTGAAGQLGRELVPLLSAAGNLIGVDREESPVQCSHRIRHDLGDMEATESLLDRFKPKIVVNAAAFTAVDAAEDTRDLSFRLNEDLPALLAQWCNQHDAFLLHYSTDYVFDGNSNRPYTEQDETYPVSVYGQSKLAGELAIAGSACRHVILRSSWIDSGHGSNFLLTMLRLAVERELLGVIADQTGCPTWARNLAMASQVVLQPALNDDGGDDGGDNGGDEVTGLFHYCDGSVTSWHGFAEAIFRQAAAIGVIERLPQLNAITTDEYPTAARRPQYSVLDTHEFRSRFNFRPPTLEESLNICIGEMTADD